MNKFEKVSFKEFYKDVLATYPDEAAEKPSEEDVKAVYDKIRLPQRATKGSAAYDLFAPFDLEIGYSHLTIPTGIRWICDDPTKVLLILPRSGQGSKYGVAIRNTAGVIDSDYWHATNEGHIFCKINAEESCEVPAGKAFAQGLIMTVGYVDDDAAPTSERTGGLGSTTDN